MQTQYKYLYTATLCGTLLLTTLISGCSNPAKDNALAKPREIPSNMNRLSNQQKTEVEQLAIDKLNQINAKSILDNREFCGYIGMKADKTIAASSILGGEIESCEPSAPDDWILLASFHSHGAYTESLNSEYPSSDDILGDYYDRTVGYISTPGGRVWKVNGEKLTAAIICEEGCVTADKDYDRSTESIRPAVTYDYLRRLEHNLNPNN